MGLGDSAQALWLGALAVLRSREHNPLKRPSTPQPRRLMASQRAGPEILINIDKTWTRVGANAVMVSVCGRLGVGDLLDYYLAESKESPDKRDTTLK